MPTSTYVYIYLLKKKREGEWTKIPVGSSLTVDPGFKYSGHFRFYFSDFSKDPGTYKVRVSNDPNEVPNVCFRAWT